MVNWKSEYIAMKLKYINSRNIITGGVSPTSEWGCTFCTYLNSEQDYMCTMCDNPRPSGQTGSPPEGSSSNVSGPGTNYLNYYAPSTYTNAPLPSTNADKNHNIEISEFFRIFLKDNSLTQEWIGRYHPAVFETYDDVMNAWNNPAAPWSIATGARFLIVPPGQRAPMRP